MTSVQLKPNQRAITACRAICVGGGIEFVWTGYHGVYQIPSSTCPTSFQNGVNGETQIAPAANVGSVTLKFNTPGNVCLLESPHLCSKHPGMQIHQGIPPGFQHTQEHEPIRGSPLVFGRPGNASPLESLPLCSSIALCANMPGSMG
jgi:hypothetical protein